MARKQPQHAPPDPMDQLVAIAESYDSKVRLLFQLRNYISLVKYDPLQAKRDRSSEFRRFVSSNDLDVWNALQAKADTRKVSKRVQNVRREVEDRQNKIRAQSLKAKRSAPSNRSTPLRGAAARAAAASAASNSTSSSPQSSRPAPQTKRRAESPLSNTASFESGDISVDPELGWPSESYAVPAKRVKRTTNLIMHPMHYVKPQLNGNLSAYLNSFRTITDDIEPITDEQWEKKVSTDAASLELVESARRSGKLARLLAEGVGNQQQMPKFTPPPPTEPSYLDNFLGHIIHYAKLQANLRKYHQSIVKRNTQSIEQYFRRLAGAEDREKKELDRQLRQLARKTSQEVMKKWRLAEKVVEQRREAVLAEQKREKGKEYLNQILDKSAKLITSRIGDVEDEDSEADEADLDEEEEDNEDDEGNVDGSDVEAGEASVVQDANDAELTLEQLREKYKNLPDIPQSSDDDEGDSDNDEVEKPSEEALRIYAETKAESGEEEEEEEESESESADDSDARRSEEESEEDSESDDEEDDTEENRKPRFGLASLLGGNTMEDDDEDAEISEPSEENEEEEDEEEEKKESENEEKVSADDVVKIDGDTTTGGDIHETQHVATPSDTPVKAAEPADSRQILDDDSNSSKPSVVKNEHDEQINKSERIDGSDNSSDDGSDNQADKMDVETQIDRRSAPSGLHRIEPPFLLKGHLREYQRNGLDWLAGLVQSGTNGILADEMGLGKTIQTIALLSWLACERHIWGPHLIVVPTSVMLNWEMEFKRFAPGFKILTYFGTPQQRKRKRRGWNKEDTWHVCITSYQLVIQDQVVFRGKRWQFMVLDEAHNIKNFRSQRWQALLNFNAQHRLLLTGTPLQNNLVELWSLLYFLMPSTRATQMMPAGFASLDDFQEWFAKPVDQMVEEGDEADDEARATISKLHQVLRPYLLRRLKIDVEKQMPGKYEHVVYCRLSKRQRYLYDDFMSRASTRATLESGNFMSILNCLMQLRKVCNHPDLFEVRPIVTSYAVDNHVGREFGMNVVPKFTMDFGIRNFENLDRYNLVLSQFEHNTRLSGLSQRDLGNQSNVLSGQLNDMLEELNDEENGRMDDLGDGSGEDEEGSTFDLTTVDGWAAFALHKRRVERVHRKNVAIRVNNMRNNRVPLFGSDCLSLLRVFKQPMNGVLSYVEREETMRPIIERYAFVTPAVTVLDYPEEMLGPKISEMIYSSTPRDLSRVVRGPLFHEPQVRLSVAFPDKRLLQYDCGKLQKLAILLRDLISGGHRCLIFTQMTRVLDILEQFLNLHGWRYLRLDGATRIEQRQALTERFNKDASIPVFILSTRSGGLGINLTGADTVIFYDSDWNPAMDRQCQDRCHRIGQTRDVHIYRLVSEFTIESNILRKATQKTILDNVVIQEGEFTTEYFSKLSVQDILGNDAGRSTAAPTIEELEGSGGTKRLEAAMAQAEDRDDQVAANLAMNEAQMDQEEFSETSRQQQVARDDCQPIDASVASAAIDSAEAQPAEIGHIDDWMIHALEHYNLYG